MRTRYVIFRHDDNKYYAYGLWISDPLGAILYKTEKEAEDRIVNMDMDDGLNVKFSGDSFEIKKIYFSQ